MSGYKYDVYLSFRGSDTRNNFVHILHKSLREARIHAVRDEDVCSDGLADGLEIENVLIDAIKQSKVLIPIISRNYASSKYCLCELVEMLKCGKTRREAIIPIFYDIEPSDLRYLEDSFEKSFLEHQRSGENSETIKNWKEALLDIANVRGLVTEKIQDRQYSKLIDAVIPFVLQKLKGRLTEPKYSVGVNDHVQAILGKLDVVHHDGQVIEDVRILGIYGAEGVGKTTVAKLVYNQLCDPLQSYRFQSCSYLKEVRELYRRRMIVSLQNQLITDLRRKRSFASSEEAVAFLAKEFRNERVLILLDDVEDVDQLNMFVGELSWFGPGSRIIVTCRESDFLSKFEEAEIYEVKPMQEGKALELFCKPAFGTVSPRKGFEALSQDFISATGGLPVALEVIGLHLHGKLEDTWKKKSERLKRTPQGKIMVQVDFLLEMSCDDLEEDAKRKFLEIALVIIYKWQDGKHGGIEVLFARGLVQFGENEELSMHGLLRAQWRKMLSTSVATIEHVVGIEDPVKEVIKLLDVKNDKVKVRIVLIHGPSGIGKTTVTKALYDRLSSCFDSCSFLADIGETTKNGGGIQFVQTKLISDILKRDDVNLASFEEGIMFFRDVFRKIRALIVLDDVEEQSHLDNLVGRQLDWFGSGSRIIVTAEKAGILPNYGSRDVGTPVVVDPYPLKEMDEHFAVELFCKHALGTHGSKPGYPKIVERFVKATGHVPLVIEVIGSLLRGKEEQEWMHMEGLIKPREENSREKCWEILENCYGALHEKQKEMFWDIAWFANGVDSRIASYMWPDRDLLRYHVLMPLVKIGEDNVLRIHKLLKHLDKYINQEWRSRQYMHFTDLEEFNKKEGKEEVEALCFDLKTLRPHIFEETDFKSMPKIRFLKLDHASMTGNFANVFPKLRWLRWHGCPRDFEATEFSPTELVILDLSWSKVTDDWGGWRLMKMEQLKVLNLTGCTDLLISPKFSSFPNLERLILERCSRLVYLDPSVGDLKKLLCLNLKSCTELNRLPAELGRLEALKELLIDGTSVEEIPLKGYSKELETLSASNCLSLSLPDGVGELAKLRRLSLRNCRWIRKLPESISQRGSPLEELDISGTGISELPDSFGNLKRLRVLKMDYCFIREFPSSIWRLQSLEEIHAASCRNLKGGIPGGIGNLENLRILRLRNSAISSLPPEIKHLSKLETLDVLHCDKLSELPELPSGLAIFHRSPKLKEKVSNP